MASSSSRIPSTGLPWAMSARPSTLRASVTRSLSPNRVPSSAASPAIASAPRQSPSSARSSAEGTSKKPRSGQSPSSSSSNRKPRAIQPPAGAAWPPLMRTKTIQPAHATARRRSPRLSSAWCARSHTATLSSSLPTRYADVARRWSSSGSSDVARSAADSSANASAHARRSNAETPVSADTEASYARAVAPSGADRAPVPTGCNPGCKVSATGGNCDQLKPLYSAEMPPEAPDRSGWGPGGRRFKSCLPDSKSLQIALFLLNRRNGCPGSNWTLGVQSLRSSEHRCMAPRRRSRALVRTRVRWHRGDHVRTSVAGSRRRWWSARLGWALLS